MQPDLSRIAEWYHGYIRQVQEDDLAIAFVRYSAEFEEFLDAIPEGKRDYAYAEGKWTIREVLQHIIDAERVFSYRALRFARRDRTQLPGFDENLFALNAKASTRDWESLRDEFRATRKSSQIMFGSFDNDQLEADGVASGTPTYVRGIAYTLLGHAIHHMKVTRERYL